MTTRYAHHTWRFGPYIYDVADKSLWLNDAEKRIDLQSKTRDLLHFLLREAVARPGRVIPREEVWKAVWQGMKYGPQEDTIDQRVTRLRNILRKEGDPDCQYVISKKKQGLRFGLPVLEERSPGRNIDTITSLAILPMLNNTADKERDDLCDSITERLIIRLKKLSQLKLTATSTVFLHKWTTKEPRDIGRELLVDAVLTSKMLMEDEAFSIRVELVDVEGGWVLWAEDFTVMGPKLSERLEEEIARELIKKIQVKVTNDEKKGLAKRHTNNAEAYGLYLKGRHLWSRRTSEGLLGGIKCFWLAIDLDSKFALAYAGVAACYNLLSYYSGRRPSETFPVARLAAETALKIDAGLAEAHTSLAYTLSRYYWKWTDAEKSYRRAIELDPSYSTAHQWYAEDLTARGRFEEATEQAEKARELAPDSSIINATVGTIFYFAGDYDRAIGQYKKTIEKDPNCIRAHFRLARAYVQKGMFDESFKTFERAKELCESEGGTFELVELANHYAAAKETDKALEIIAEVEKLTKHRYTSEYNIATVYASLREEDQALKWLERAYESRDPWIEHLNVDPRLDTIRKHTKFEELVQRIETT
jgi:TolB-like protein/Tfp pilus assembly protein PilF